MFKPNYKRMVEQELTSTEDRLVTILIDPNFTPEGKTYGLLITYNVYDRYTNEIINSFDTFNEAKTYAENC